MKMIEATSTKDRVKKVRKLILSAGNSFGNVHFIKKSDGTKRRMSFRLHVVKPSYCRAPQGTDIQYRKARAARDRQHNLMTVYDVNMIRYDKKNKMNGRGGYKSIPLDAVTRVSVGGTIYKILGVD